jgi:hypothetical protein
MELMMAWIKVDHLTPDKPEVIAMANELGIDQDAVVGKLVRFWIWCDQQLKNGEEIQVTFSFIDRLTACKSFATSMQHFGWLEVKYGRIFVPNFTRHNGETAKNRAETQKRVAKSRNANVTLEPLQKPLPEKERERERDCISMNPPTPLDESVSEVAPQLAGDLENFQGKSKDKYERLRSVLRSKAGYDGDDGIAFDVAAAHIVRGDVDETLAIESADMSKGRKSSPAYFVGVMRKRYPSLKFNKVAKQ